MNALNTIVRTHGRKLLACLWLLAPVALLGLHYGPGQHGVATDRIAKSVNAARAAEAAGDWPAAVAAWRGAVGEVPAHDHDARTKLTLQYQMARVMGGELPEALEETAALLTEARAAGVSQGVEREVRAKLAAMHYWAAWLMRLEGAAAEEWEPVADQARQQFRLLAETERGGDDEHRRNLEATIRLQRMDLSQLQALPLPKECQGTKDCSGKCKSQRQSRLKNPGDGTNEDARDQVQKDKRMGAGVYNRSDAAGW